MSLIVQWPIISRLRIEPYVQSIPCNLVNNLANPGLTVWRNMPILAGNISVVIQPSMLVICYDSYAR